MFMHHSQSFCDMTPVKLGVPHPAAAPAAAPGGLSAACLVETEAGWRPVGTLRPGVRIATYDGGFAPVREIRRTRRASGDRAAVAIPGGALGNCSDAIVAPGQLLVISTGVAADVLGVLDVLVPAACLVGWRGIRRVHSTPPGTLTLVFEQAEIVYANSGVLALCPGVSGTATYIPELDPARADALVALLRAGARHSGEAAADGCGARGR
jgi:hypothetical protein